MKKVFLILLSIIVLLIIGYFMLQQKESKEGIDTSTNDTNNVEIENEIYTMENIYNYISAIKSNISDIHNYIMMKDDKLLIYTIEDLSESMKQFNDYNNYIQSLNDSKYDKLKQYWLDYSEEVNNLYTKIKNKDYTAKNGIISNDKLDKFYNYLCDETYKLK